MKYKNFILSFVAVLITAAGFACGSSDDVADDPHERCGLSEDYDILQVPPDPCLWSDPEFGKTFTAAYDATNVAKGSCHETSFTVRGDEGIDRIYRDSDTLRITIEYNAPGCADSTLTFGGFHVNGSPWATEYCAPQGCNFGGIGSNIFAEPISLTEPTGILTFIAQPGTFPPLNLASPPNLEGFQLCAIVVGFSDGKLEGSRTSDQLDFASKACEQQP